MSLPQTVTINNTAYPTAELPDVARTQLLNIQVVDAEIVRLQQSLAISQTARGAYVAALLDAVAAKPAAKPAAAKPAKAAKPRATKN